MIHWVTTKPNPRSPATGHDAGQRGWKLHAVHAPEKATFGDIKYNTALCGLRASHGWDCDMFIEDKCRRCTAKLQKKTISVQR